MDETANWRHKGVGFLENVWFWEGSDISLYNIAKYFAYF